MTPNSIEYLLLLPLIVTAYYLLATEYRWIVLLVASYGIYASIGPIFCLLLLISTILDYWAALRIEANKEDQVAKRWYLGISISVNLGFLVAFKFLDFNLMHTNGLQTGIRPSALVIPIGISYYTLQTIGYTIDVYKGRIQAERHFGRFAVFVSFFPQLMAGPIEKARYLLGQLHHSSPFQWTNISAGARLIIFGLFKKIVVADHLGAWIPPFSNGEVNGPWLLLLLFMVSVWVLMDFSAYCDLAIGSARLFGIRLSSNFKRPFLAGSLLAFWQKWHITLFRWFRDYVYIPMRQSYRGQAWKYVSIFVIFVLSGLWHGATLNLVLFGIYNGILVMVEWSIFQGRYPKNIILKWSIWLLTIAIWSVGAIFFTSSNWAEALQLLIRLGVFESNLTSSIKPLLDLLLISLCGLLVISALDLNNTNDLNNPIDSIGSKVIRWMIYCCLLFSILMLGNETSNTFIYLQF